MRDIRGEVLRENLSCATLVLAVLELPLAHEISQIQLIVVIHGLQRLHTLQLLLNLSHRVLIRPQLNTPFVVLFLECSQLVWLLIVFVGLSVAHDLQQWIHLQLLADLALEGFRLDGNLTLLHKEVLVLLLTGLGSCALRAGFRRQL